MVEKMNKSPPNEKLGNTARLWNVGYDIHEWWSNNNWGYSRISV